MPGTLKSPVLVPQWVPKFQWESRVPSCLPHLSLISIFVDNKSICTGSGMSTWAHMDQRWFIQCVKEGRKGTTGPAEKKTQGLSSTARGPLSSPLQPLPVVREGCRIIGPHG